MAEKLDPRQVVTFEELLRAMMMEQDATRRVLVRKGLLTNEEVLEEIKVVRREMEGKRVVAGLRKAKASGKHIGRPKTVLNRLRIVQLRSEGMCWREIARRVGLPVSTVYRYRGLLNNSTAHFGRT